MFFDCSSLEMSYSLINESRVVLFSHFVAVWHRVFIVLHVWELTVLAHVDWLLNSHFFYLILLDAEDYRYEPQEVKGHDQQIPHFGEGKEVLYLFGF